MKLRRIQCRPTLRAADVAIATEIGGHTRFQAVLWRRLFPAPAEAVMLAAMSWFSWHNTQPLVSLPLIAKNY